MSVLISMSLFAFTMSATPGPANILTLSTGINYGFRKALPFVMGATLGFTLLLLSVGLSMEVIARYSAGLLPLLSYAGCAFILYLGYGIMTASGALGAGRQPLPGFIQGAALQWLNPKAWAAAWAGASAFNVGTSAELLAQFAAVYFLICLGCMSSWALLGGKLMPVVSDAKFMGWVNRLMGFALILVALQLVLLPL